MTSITYSKSSIELNDLKDRFINSEMESFSDFELIKLMLHIINPAENISDLAQKLYSLFENPGMLINHNYELLQKELGISKSHIVLFKLIKEISIRSLKNNI